MVAACGQCEARGEHAMHDDDDHCENQRDFNQHDRGICTEDVVRFRFSSACHDKVDKRRDLCAGRIDLKHLRRTPPAPPRAGPDSLGI